MLVKRNMCGVSQG